MGEEFVEAVGATTNGASVDAAEAPAGRYARDRRPRELLVDPEISRRKLAAELSEYAKIAADRRRLGWWILRAEFPEVMVAFASPHLRPTSVLFGALLDFKNYDLWAPSVTIVDPFTEQPLHLREIPQALHLNRQVIQSVEVEGVGLLPQPLRFPLLQAHGDALPFICLAGIREYHDHPAHSGDSWFDHRGRGEGTLYFILEKLYQYGVEPIKAYQMGIHIAGFSAPELPL